MKNELDFGPKFEALEGCQKKRSVSCLCVKQVTLLPQARDPETAFYVPFGLEKERKARLSVHHVIHIL
jgi:hypothetical protein